LSTVRQITILIHVTITDEERRPSPGEVFGRQVRDARRAHGWSQTALAQRLTAAGVPLNQGGVSRTEEGKRPVSLDEAVVIARILGVDLPQTLRALVTGAQLTPAEREEEGLWLGLLDAGESVNAKAILVVTSQEELVLAEVEFSRAQYEWLDAQRRLGDQAPERDPSFLFEGIRELLQLARREPHEEENRS
jgi:transcriptional regulator with XRE-family HTH domain